MKTIATLLLLSACSLPAVEQHDSITPDETAIPRATQCDGSGFCVTCDGRPSRRELLLTPDGLWNPSTDEWELVDESEAGYSWCRR